MKQLPMSDAIDKPIDWKVGDRVRRPRKIHDAKSLMRFGTVVKAGSHPNIYERLYAVRWDDGSYEDAFFWWGLRHE